MGLDTTWARGIGELYVLLILSVVIVITLILLYGITRNFTSYAGEQASRIVELSSTQFSAILSNATGHSVMISMVGNPPIPLDKGAAMCIVTNGTDVVVQCSYNRVAAGVINVNLSSPPPMGSLLSVNVPMSNGQVAQLRVSYGVPDVSIIAIPTTSPSGQLINETILVRIINNSTGWVYVNTVLNINNESRINLGEAPIPPGQVVYFYGSIPLSTTRFTMRVDTTINWAYTVSFTYRLPTPPCTYGYPTSGIPTMNSTLRGGDYRVYNGYVGGLPDPLYMYSSLGILGSLVPYYFTVYYNLSGVSVSDYPILTAYLYPTEATPGGAAFFVVVIFNDNTGVMYTWSNSINVPPPIFIGNSPVMVTTIEPHELLMNTWNYLKVNLTQYSGLTYKYLGMGIYLNPLVLGIINTVRVNITIPILQSNVTVPVTIQLPKPQLAPSGAGYWDFVCLNK